MVKINPYLIPKEKLPKTEQIIYLDHNYQPQSYEEFMKTYEPSEEVEFITRAEYQDRLLHGPQYGPGNERWKEIGKFALKATTSAAAAGAILATGGAAIPFVLGGIAATAGGEAARLIAKDNDNEVLEWIGDTVSSTGINLATGGLGSAVGAVSTSRSLASVVVRETVKNGRESYEGFSLIKDSVELYVDYYHARHRDEGISYKSDCRVCNK